MAPGGRERHAAVYGPHPLLRGPGLAVEAVRANAATTPAAGIVLNLSPCEPASDDPADARAAERADGHTNRWWLDPLHGRGYPPDMVDLYGIEPAVRSRDLEVVAAPLDFLGVNYYFRMRVAADETVATLGY